MYCIYIHNEVVTDSKLQQRSLIDSKTRAVWFTPRLWQFVKIFLFLVESTERDRQRGRMIIICANMSPGIGSSPARPSRIIQVDGFLLLHSCVAGNHRSDFFVLILAADVAQL